MLSQNATTHTGKTFRMEFLGKDSAQDVAKFKYFRTTKGGLTPINFKQLKSTT